jgi:hypothetical protein
LDGEKLAKSIAYLHGFEELYYDGKDFSPGTLYADMSGIPFIDDERFPRTVWTRIGLWAFNTIQDKASSSDNPFLQLNHWMMAMVATVIEIGKDIPEFKEHDRIWSSVLEHYYEKLVKKNNLESLTFLAENDWPVWQREPIGFEEKVFDAIEEQFTLWMGRWWRDCNEDQQNEYRRQMRELANSTVELKHRTALLIIYHTVPNMNVNEKVDEHLWKIFHDVWDSDTSQTIEKVKNNLHFLVKFVERQEDLRKA